MIVHEYGVKELYRGLVPILLRNGPSNALFFVLREEAQKLPQKVSSVYLFYPFSFPTSHFRTASCTKTHINSSRARSSALSSHPFSIHSTSSRSWFNQKSVEITKTCSWYCGTSTMTGGDPSGMFTKAWTWIAFVRFSAGESWMRRTRILKKLFIDGSTGKIVGKFSWKLVDEMQKKTHGTCKNFTCKKHSASF